MLEVLCPGQRMSLQSQVRFLRTRSHVQCGREAFLQSSILRQLEIHLSEARNCKIPAQDVGLWVLSLRVSWPTLHSGPKQVCRVQLKRVECHRNFTQMGPLGLFQSCPHHPEVQTAGRTDTRATVKISHAHPEWQCLFVCVAQMSRPNGHPPFA